MYNIEFKNVKKGYKTGVLFTVVGLLFLVLMGWLILGPQIAKMKLDSETKATQIDENCHRDSDGDYMCSPIYYFNVDGNEYTCKSSSSSNQTVSTSYDTVYYDSKNPKNCVTEYETKPSIMLYICLLIPLVCIYAGIRQIIKTNDRVKRLNVLANTGVLVKNLQYTMEPTGVRINDREILAITVDYTLPTGSKIHLVGDPRYDRQQSDADGLVDLLIDPSDNSNFYIDFNITRKY